MPIYAVPGTTEQHIGPKYLVPDGAELMQYPQPTDEHVAQADGTWAIPFEVASKLKLVEILTKSDATMEFITSKYSRNEKLSWPKQEKEALELQTDPNAPAPFLRGLATARGIDLTVLRDKVLANVSLSEQVTSYILGQQQAYEDRLRAATTSEEVVAIVVEYNIPDLG